MKEAIAKCRYWLEGAIHLFQVITDHKNLEYIKSAKRLNPRQAQWALFFTRFQFTVTYRPGRKTAKLMPFLDVMILQLTTITLNPYSLIQW